jgi:hypothetical protein
VPVSVARAAIKEYENLGGTAEEFREPFARRIVHSIPARYVAPLTGLGLVAFAGLYAIGVIGLSGGETIPHSEIKSIATTDLGQAYGTIVNAAPRILTHSDSGATEGATGQSLPAAATGESSARSGGDRTSMPSSTATDSIANSPGDIRATSHERLAYSVHSGDTIEGIALRHLGSPVKVRSVIAANPQLKNVNRIYPGETVFLPAEATPLRETGSR